MQSKGVCMGLEAELEHFITKNANNKAIYSVAVQ